MEHISKKAAMIIREEIIKKNPNFRSHDIVTNNNMYYKYLHDKKRDIDFVWYKKTFERTTTCRTTDPEKEDFEDFFSVCKNEELKELILTIFTERLSELTRDELIEFIYKQYQDSLEYA